MILLPNANPILESTLARLLQPIGQGKKRDQVNISICDFDGCQFNLQTNPKQRNLVSISIQWSLMNEEVMKSCNEHLSKVYGPLTLSPPSPGYNFSIQVDLDNPQQKAEEIIEKVSLFKRNVFSAPFLALFKKVAAGTASKDVVIIPYRTGEAVYLKPEGDRVIVIFSINFSDPDDIIYSKVFLTEFQDAKRTIRAAPSVMFSQGNAPLELKDVPGVNDGKDQGFVSFALSKGHVQDDRAQATVDILNLFRNYLQYHIKCSKAYMHTRMRIRVASLLQVLNRAKMKEEDGEKKTATGRTFTRK